MRKRRDKVHTIKTNNRAKRQISYKLNKNSRPLTEKKLRREEKKLLKKQEKKEKRKELQREKQSAIDIEENE